MNFANVKAITIPEGNVKQIADGNGVVLWKKGADWEVIIRTDLSSGDTFWDDYTNDSFSKRCPYRNGSRVSGIYYSDYHDNYNICRFKVEGSGLTGKQVKLKMGTNGGRIKMSSSKQFYGRLYRYYNKWTTQGSIVLNNPSIPSSLSSAYVGCYDSYFLSPNLYGNIDMEFAFVYALTSGSWTDMTTTISEYLGVEVVDTNEEIVWLTGDNTYIGATSGDFVKGSTNMLYWKILLPESLVKGAGINVGDTIAGWAYKGYNNSVYNDCSIVMASDVYNTQETDAANLPTPLTYTRPVNFPKGATTIDSVYSLTEEFVYEGNNIGIGKYNATTYTIDSRGNMRTKGTGSGGALGTGQIKYSNSSSGTYSTYGYTPAIGLIVRRSS